jgi:Tfp pilus assembly protein PilP
MSSPTPRVLRDRPVRPPAGLAALAVLLALGLPAAGCGGDETQVTQQRGMPNQKPIVNEPRKSGGGGGGGGSRRSNGGGSKAPAEEEPELERPDRPRPVLTRDDFSGRARDPFHNYLAAEVIDTPEPVEVVRKQREVKLAEYTFEELRLIAIVNAGRNVAPTALFLASDNKSKPVKQGEYFSSAEVLLASVNRDYIEIEIIDPELTPGWNMERGERKVIYLKDH